MKTNPENIPVHVYEWMEQNSFEQLDPARQAEVLLYLSAAEYNTLHTTGIHIGRLKKVFPASGRTQIKKQLLGVFDAHHQNKKQTIPLWQKTISVWKAAAIVVLLMGAWVYVYLDTKKEVPGQLVAQVDTVYVTKEVPSEPLKIHDTVYVTKYKNSSKKETVKAREIQGQQNGSMSAAHNQPLNAVNVSTIENRSNQPKGNSMKDDTLLKKYSFVTM